MALNIGQAGDVNIVVSHLGGNPGTSRGEAIEALARLADAAYRSLKAGFDADRAREHLEHGWPEPAVKP